MSKHLDVMMVADCASGEAEPVTQHVLVEVEPRQEELRPAKATGNPVSKTQNKTKTNLKKKKKP